MLIYEHSEKNRSGYNHTYCSSLVLLRVKGLRSSIHLRYESGILPVRFVLGKLVGIMRQFCRFELNNEHSQMLSWILFDVLLKPWLKIVKRVGSGGYLLRILLKSVKVLIFSLVKKEPRFRLEKRSRSNSGGISNNQHPLLG